METAQAQCTPASASSAEMNLKELSIERFPSGHVPSSEGWVRLSKIGICRFTTSPLHSFRRNTGVRVMQFEGKFMLRHNQLVYQMIQLRRGLYTANLLIDH